jgi:hypothetical protein
MGLPGRRAILAIGLLVMFTAVAFNLYTVAHLFRAGVMPLLSLVCVAFGGYVLFSQWVTFRTTPATGRRAAAALL